MSITETYYLIDFENVHKEGLPNANKLGSHDHIHIFFTNNNKITSTDIAPFKSKSIEHQLHNVPSGKQSLDMHLVTYLGFLIGSNTNKKCKYIIVSKDKGFDKIISFLKKESPANTSITRQPKINPILKKSSVQTSTVLKATPIASNNILATSASMVTPTLGYTLLTIPQYQLNMEIQQAIRQAGYTRSTISKVASIVAAHYEEDKFLSNVHNELKNTYSDYLDIYQIIKPILKKYS